MSGPNQDLVASQLIGNIAKQYRYGIGNYVDYVKTQNR